MGKLWDKWSAMSEARKELAEIDGGHYEEKTVTMVVPVSFSPLAVVERYNELRSVACGPSELRALKKRRSIGIDLSGEVVAACRLNDGRSWASVLRSGARFRDYGSARAFAVQIRDSYWRLTGKPLEWKRKSGVRG